MANPAFLKLNTVTCNATEDLIGSDDLVGVMGADRFKIGRFNDSESQQVSIERPIVAGVTTLRIIEEDLDPDDELGRIDLSQDLDQNRTVHLRHGRADYVFKFFVASQSD